MRVDGRRVISNRCTAFLTASERVDRESALRAALCAACHVRQVLMTVVPYRFIPRVLAWQSSVVMLKIASARRPCALAPGHQEAVVVRVASGFQVGISSFVAEQHVRLGVCAKVPMNL
jgi:hypothetical protein